MSRQNDDLTIQLQQWAQGHAEIADTLIPAVYAELRRMAGSALKHENNSPPTAATSLVHDLFLRLANERQIAWQNRAHFFGIAARMMRQLLVARARNRNALKRGGGQQASQLDDEHTPNRDWLEPEELIELNRALEELESLDAQKARIVEYRFFAGLSIEETAEAMSLSPATVKRHWEFARRWLHHKVSGAGEQLKEL